MAKSLSYKQAGVNIDAADKWTETIKKMVQRTYSPRVFSGVGGFAGLFRLDYNEKLFKQNYKQPVLVACTDGVGTKILIAMQANKLDTVGIDLVAMSVNDMVVTGAEPLFFLDYMAIGKLTPEKTVELLKGITEGCQQSDCALIGGETAEMPDLYDEDEFDLAGFAVGVVELKKMLDGTQIEPGDTILGLASSGIHSNGFSLVRKIIFDKCKHKIDDELPGFGCTVAEELLRPTKIYVRSILSVLRKYKTKHPIRGMAHITGGGLVGNVPRILPKDCKAVIHADAWPIPKIFNYLEKKGPVKRSEMFRVFNMGIGMVLVVRSASANAVTKQLTEMGETVYNLGRITKGKPEVELR
jgi:phosphoribosylformylglycinamidine cyclo-ligase